MESMLSKIKKLKFLNKRLCGIWLIWIGFIIFLGTLLGGNYLINPFIFSVGYALGYFFIFCTPLFRKHFSYGKHSKFQAKTSKLSVILLFVLMCLFSGRYFGVNNYRLIWLGALLATAIHFIPFSIVHGKLLLIMSIPLILTSLLGILDSNISFCYLAFIDAVIKILFGIILFISKKPTGTV